MCKNKENSQAWPLLSQIVKLIKSEVTTAAGRMNLISDIILAIIVLGVFTANTLERIAITVVSVWNPEIASHLTSADTLIAFIILVGFFVLCLIFLYVYEKMKDGTK